MDADGGEVALHQQLVQLLSPGHRLHKDDNLHAPATLSATAKGLQHTQASTPTASAWAETKLYAAVYGTKWAFAPLSAMSHEE